MSLKKEEWPEVGELVVATANLITDFGVYLRLDEYDRSGFLHISEISSSWVKNIRDYVREGQKVVLKVLRVDPARKHIDLSLRRVTRRERIEKMLQWKRSKKSESLLRNASKKLKIPFDEVYEKAGLPIEKSFGDIYDGLERAAREGAETLLKIGVPEDLAITLANIAKERIKIPMVKVKGILNLQNTKPDGVIRIKEALLNAQKISKPEGTNLNIYVVATPRYRVEVSAHNYKEAESLLKRLVETAIKNMEERGGKATFTRSG